MTGDDILLTFTYQRPISELPEASLHYLSDGMLFFDIETTGLSSSRNRIYLVGLGWLDGEQLTVRQYLAENASDEASVLDATMRIASDTRFETLVSFNGTTFDLPFFEKRCVKHIVALADNDSACTTGREATLNSITALDHLDLYRTIHPIRHFFPMEHFRQKDYEALLGIGREDQYDGGKLVTVYHRFEKTKKQADCDLLCLHNKEDLFGMFHLISLLACLQVKENDSDKLYSIDSLQATSANEVSIRFHLDTPVPVSIRQLKTTGSLLLRKTSGLAVLPIYKGSLRCYLPNPKDYFYLTAENTVVHKSVGQFVDPAFRRKAEPEECYTEYRLPTEYLDGEVHPYCEDGMFENVQKVLEGFLRQV